MVLFLILAPHKLEAVVLTGKKKYKNPILGLFNTCRTIDYILWSATAHEVIVRGLGTSRRQQQGSGHRHSRSVDTCQMSAVLRRLKEHL